MMQKPVSSLIAALGGEGGGVLSDWIIDVATALDFPVQSTSVPGVAQRTGATTYYLEVYPQPRAALGGRQPVLALTPGPGDVDLVAASELVEAGRVLQNGLADPARTTLVFSTHREYAVAEKMQMGDGRYDGERVFDAARELAREVIAFDMRDIAWRQGTIINTVLFGAMVGSGRLPFPRDACEAAIRRSGKAVEASLRGFAAGYERAAARSQAAAEEREAAAAQSLPLPAEVDAALAALPPPVRPLAAEGWAQLADYQDAAYARRYLEQVTQVCAREREAGGAGAVGAEVARFLALWMGYEDVVRVAELKTRGERLERLRREVGAKPGEVLRVTEYLKPGMEELCSLLPPRLAQWLERRAGPQRRGFALRLRSDTVAGFAALCLLRGFKRWRPRSARYATEQAAMRRWLAAITARLADEPAAALELARCGNLIKGYGDTAARGRRSLGLILDAAEQGADAATLRTAREAALADPAGQALSRSLSLPEPAARPVPVRLMRRRQEEDALTS